MFPRACFEFIDGSERARSPTASNDTAAPATAGGVEPLSWAWPRQVRWATNGPDDAQPDRPRRWGRRCDRRNALSWDTNDSW